MRVLIISQHFAPEIGATTNRILSLAHGLVAAGHDVTVVAAKPNHPEGMIWPEYRGGLLTEKRHAGIRTIHTWLYAQPQKTFRNRLLSYASFMVMAVVAALRPGMSCDLVLATSPPLFSGVGGWLAARFRRAKFVFDVRDLWPDLAIAIGELNNPLARRLAKAMEHFLYHRSDALTTVTQSFQRAISHHLARSQPIACIPNGTLPVFLEAGQQTAPEPADKFVVTYAGNIGICQGMIHLADAAEALQEDPEIEIRVIGEGPVKEQLIRRVRERRLENLSVLPKVPLEQAARAMADSDAVLVPLAAQPIYSKFVPSKLYDGMAVGRPVLLSVDGEARAILEEASAGLYYPAEDGGALAERIRWLKENPAEGAAMGRRGADFVRGRYMRADLAKEMVTFLEELV